MLSALTAVSYTHLDVYKRQVLLYFKDAVTGTEGRIDSGGNEVIGEVAGKGNASFRLTLYFFALLQKAGIPTHFLETGPKENTIIVRSARCLLYTSRCV